MGDVADSRYFHEYFSEWIDLYKHGAVRNVTFQKYQMTLQSLKKIAPELKMCDLDKREYQKLLNKYAETHERTTVMDFHHQLKSVILDAVDEKLIPIDLTRRIIVKGKPPAVKKPKFLSEFELQLLLAELNLTNKYKRYTHRYKNYKSINWDWLILLLAKTGLRFAEALGLTPSDFDFERHKIKVTKTWDYKNPEGGFAKTKNEASKRTIQIDTELSSQFLRLTEEIAADTPIFVRGRVFNSTLNDRLKSLCKKAGVPVIAVHGLRHTHASLLLYAGVSISSVAKRLGHAKTTTTQEVYLHIVKELEEKDNEKVVGYLANLTNKEEGVCA